MFADGVVSGSAESLSARRAWIEIFNTQISKVKKGVALRKESVDRNTSEVKPRIFLDVALRKESVDRNFQVCIVARGLFRRSPQGERG